MNYALYSTSRCFVVKYRLDRLRMPSFVAAYLALLSKRLWNYIAGYVDTKDPDTTGYFLRSVLKQVLGRKMFSSRKTTNLCLTRIKMGKVGLSPIRGSVQKALNL